MSRARIFVAAAVLGLALGVCAGAVVERASAEPAPAAPVHAVMLVPLVDSVFRDSTAAVLLARAIDSTGKAVKGAKVAVYATPYDNVDITRSGDTVVVKGRKLGTVKVTAVYVRAGVLAPLTASRSIRVVLAPYIPGPPVRSFPFFDDSGRVRVALFDGNDSLVVGHPLTVQLDDPRFPVVPTLADTSVDPRLFVPLGVARDTARRDTL